MHPDLEADGDEDGSWFGRVTRCKTSEQWPLLDGEPLVPICQIRLSDSPFVPEILADISMITFFLIHNEFGQAPKMDTRTPGRWMIRTYRHGEELIPIEQPEHRHEIIAAPIRFEYFAADLPDLGHASIHVPI